MILYYLLRFEPFLFCPDMWNRWIEVPSTITPLLKKPEQCALENTHWRTCLASGTESDTWEGLYFLWSPKWCLMWCTSQTISNLFWGAVLLFIAIIITGKWWDSYTISRSAAFFKNKRANTSHSLYEYHSCQVRTNADNHENDNVLKILKHVFWPDSRFHSPYSILQHPPWHSTYQNPPYPERLWLHHRRPFQWFSWTMWRVFNDSFEVDW